MNRLSEIEQDWGKHPRLIKAAHWLPVLNEWPDKFLYRVSKTISSEWLRVLHKGRFIHHSELLEAMPVSLRDGTRRVSIKSVKRFLDEGATVVIRCADSYDDHFHDLVEALTARFKSRVSCNFYLARADGKGYGPHFDTHHVFALQLYGTKHWRIERSPAHGTSKAAPISDQLGALKDNASLITVIAEPGDVLYIPKGVRHQASPGENGSCHASYGIHMPTGAEICQNIYLERAILDGANLDVLDFFGNSEVINMMKVKETLGVLK